LSQTPVSCWRSVFCPRKPLSILSFRVIVILIPYLFVSSCGLGYFLFSEEEEIFNFYFGVGQAHSLAKLWLKRWLVGL
jgi:hypothetical protein